MTTSYAIIIGVMLILCGIFRIVVWWEERRWYLDPTHYEDRVMEWCCKDLDSVPSKVDWITYELWCEYQLERGVDDLNVQHFQMSRQEFLRGEEIIPAPKYEKVYR